MARIQLANGNWVDESTLPMKDGKRYDPTAETQAMLGGGAPPARPDIAQSTVNPNDPNMQWDANSGRWIQKPGTVLPYEMAKRGYMQTAGAQQSVSDQLSRLYGGPPSQGRPNESQPLNRVSPQVTAQGSSYAPKQYGTLDPQNVGQPSSATGFGGLSGLQGDDGGSGPVDPITAVGGSAGGGGGNGTDGNFYEPLGLPPDSWFETPQNNLGEMPEMNSGWQPGFEGNFFNTAENVRNRLGQIYESPLEQMNAAQINRGEVPQPNANPTDSFEQLQFLLSGQGFDPKTIAQMKANAGDTLASGNAARMSAGRMAAQRAGLGSSGISVALQDQAARDNAAGLNQANNQIDIQNAMQGIKNLTTGAGMELNRGQTNAQQANLMALQNAQMMFQAMQQNTANSQQANLTNTQNRVGQQMTSQNAQSNQMANAGNQFGQATLNQAANANQQNAANRYNWNLSQANLNQRNNEFNMGNRNTRYNNALNITAGMGNAAGNAAGNYNNSANVVAGSVQPNTAIPSAISNAGANVLNSAARY